MATARRCNLVKTPETEKSRDSEISLNSGGAGGCVTNNGRRGDIRKKGAISPEVTIDI